MRIPTLIPLAVLLLAAAAVSACGESAAHRAAREQARRNSCVAAELALTAKERVARLDTELVVVQGGPLEQITQAGRSFAAAYEQYAQAYSQYADWSDSAASAGSDDASARYTQMAASARPQLPPAGTVPGNAAARFTGDMTQALNNPDHPCNQPKEEDEGS